MQENRNATYCSQNDGRGTVCIDTNRVLDSCRDRDCFENARVYLTSFGEEVINSANSVRIRSAKLIWAFVGVDEVPFNNGFYQITVRYYILIEGEACLGIGKSQTFKGIAVLEKNVVLYGGEGSIISFSSSPENDYCSIGNIDTVSYNDPVAIVETAEPIVLGSKVVDCTCPCERNECIEIPSDICGCLDGQVNTGSDNARLYVSFGIFSVIRIQRPAQLLVQATDYSVPDKECCPATNNDNPCALFNSMAFPTNQFKTTSKSQHIDTDNNDRGGNCGCRTNK